jgi:ribose 5-phosphate isomerase A
VDADVAIDSADPVAPSGWLVEVAAPPISVGKPSPRGPERFVVIVSSKNLVERPAPPIPLELLDYGLSATLARVG